MKKEIIKNPEHYDHDKVLWYDEEWKVIWNWYVWREGDDIMCMLRCPKCGKENYCMTIPTWNCAWCEFNPN